MLKLFKRWHNWVKDYVFDTSINIKDRTFILFSLAVLVALFLAIPCGLIMREPPLATVSTAVGLVAFSLYVYICFRKERIARARIVISFVLVFIFLPSMLITNGGIESGAPIWLLLGTFYIAMILEGRLKIIMIACEVVVMVVSWVITYYYPEIVTGYSRGGNYFDTLTGLIIVGGVVYLMVSFYTRILSKEEESKNVRRLFEQTATALVNAIDAKDRYTHGHSARVAEYSKKIAEQAGKSPAECEEIYYVALLHDVGKIGISEAIINKEGKLTEEEYGKIKEHPELGSQILQSITEFPFISIGAHFHHERFDGKGYPMGLKGTDIPEVARIISVADAYDAMTSKRSYRDAIPQDKVREELIRGAGTQFDPEFSNIMLYLLDLDPEYELREQEENQGISGRYEMVIGEHRDEVSEGILVTPNMTTIEMTVSGNKRATGRTPNPSFVLFDSLDGRFHDDPMAKERLLYYEYCEIDFNGSVTGSGIRKSETKVGKASAGDMGSDRYRIEAVRVKDHILIRILGHDKSCEVTIALPDSTRYAYIGITGEHCRITNVRVDKSEETVPNDYIPRIAEEISYINVPAGDIPNVQVDGYRSDSTDGIPIRDGMKISFHSKNLPTARLVWHCPAYIIFTSDDGKVTGNNYRELSLVRLDGEYWDGNTYADNELAVNRDDFENWDEWKKLNNEGFDCEVTFERHGSRIVSRTKNGGIAIRNDLNVLIETEELYVAISGDQVALTNIRIEQGNKE